MNVDQERLEQIAKAIESDGNNVKEIMERMTPEERAKAIANDETKKAEARGATTRNMDMTILGVNPQQSEQEVGRHK